MSWNKQQKILAIPYPIPLNACARYITPIPDLNYQYKKGYKISIIHNNYLRVSNEIYFVMFPPIISPSSIFEILAGTMGKWKICYQQALIIQYPVNIINNYRKCYLKICFRKWRWATVLIKLEAQIFSIHHLDEKKLDQKEAIIHKHAFIYQGKNNIYHYISGRATNTKEWQFC